MTPYIVVGVVGLVLFLLFVYSAVRMAHEPDPPTPIDPETRSNLRAFEARGLRRTGDDDVWGDEPNA